MRKLKHEIAITEAITGIGNAVVDAAKAACSENTDPTE
jgi:hypothetical protein